MKKITLTMVMITIAITLLAQSPQAFKYQAVARDNAGDILADQAVSFRIIILKDSINGDWVYVETHQDTTNQFGMVTLEIGNGTVVAGVFEDIDWGNELHFLKIRMDATGGTNYLTMGTTQLMSVPYALFAESSRDAGATSINDLTDAKTAGNNVYLGQDAGVNDDSTNNQNVAMGREALMENTSGYYNIATGYNALQENTEGNANSASGFNSSASNTTGNHNTTYGTATNLFNQEGSNNTMIGHQAGRGTVLHNKSGNVFLGYQAGYNDTTDNKLYIENSNADSANALIYGDFENDILTFNAKVGIGTTNPGAKLDVRGSVPDDGPIFKIGNSDGSHRLTFFPGRENDPNPFIQWKEGDPLRFSTDEGGWSEKMRITSDGRMGIGTYNPEESALLDLNSNSKGFMPPRMTDAERDAISSPAAGLMVWCNNCGASGELQVYNGTSWTNIIGDDLTPPVPPEVYNPATGETWMACNLGTSHVADSCNDAAAYGDLYQWGRLSDGQESRTSGDTTTLSNVDDPGHSNFILSPGSPGDWRSPQNPYLWQNVIGGNNPCPNGFRLPTSEEWWAERQSWDTYDSAGAFGSPLKLTIGGGRWYDIGFIIWVGVRGYYWSSYYGGYSSRCLEITGDEASLGSLQRAAGASVRCIKD